MWGHPQWPQPHSQEQISLLQQQAQQYAALQTPWPPATVPQWGPPMPHSTAVPPPNTWGHVPPTSVPPNTMPPPVPGYTTGPPQPAPPDAPPPKTPPPPPDEETDTPKPPLPEPTAAGATDAANQWASYASQWQDYSAAPAANAWNAGWSVPPPGTVPYQNQWPTAPPPIAAPPPPPPPDSGSKPQSEPAFDVENDPDLKEFDRQFTDWEKQFQQWKKENHNHPDKSALKSYEEDWNKWREDLLDKRRELRESKIQQLKSQPAAAPPYGTVAPPVQNYGAPPAQGYGPIPGYGAPPNYGVPPYNSAPQPSQMYGAPPSSTPSTFTGQPPPSAKSSNSTAPDLSKDKNSAQQHPKNAADHSMDLEDNTQDANTQNNTWHPTSVDRRHTGPNQPDIKDKMTPPASTPTPAALNNKMKVFNSDLGSSDGKVAGQQPNKGGIPGLDLAQPQQQGPEKANLDAPPNKESWKDQSYKYPMEGSGGDGPNTWKPPNDWYEDEDDQQDGPDVKKPRLSDVDHREAGSQFLPKSGPFSDSSGKDSSKGFMGRGGSRDGPMGPGGPRDGPIGPGGLRDGQMGPGGPRDGPMGPRGGPMGPGGPRDGPIGPGRLRDGSMGPGGPRDGPMGPGDAYREGTLNRGFGSQDRQMDRDEQFDRSRSSDRDGAPYGQDGPMGRGEPQGYGGPMGRDGSMDRGGGQMGWDNQMERRGPMGHEGPMDRGGPVGWNGPMDRRVPMGRDSPMDRGGPMGRDAPMDRGGPMGRDGQMDRGAPMGRGGPMHSGGPMGRGDPMDRGGPMGRNGPMDRGGPMGRDGPMDRGGPMGHDGPMDRGGPMGSDGPMDRGGPMGRDGPMDRGGPMGRDGPMDICGPMGRGGPPDKGGLMGRGGPMDRGGPLGHDIPMDRGGLLGRDGPMDRSGPMSRDGPMDRGGPMGRDGPMDRGGPIGRDGPMDRGGPMGRGGLMDRGGPMGRDGPMDRGGLMGYDGSIDRGGSMARDGPMDRYGPIGRDGPMDRGGPMGRDGPMDRGGLMSRDGPMDRGGPMGRDGPMDRGGPMGRDGPMDRGGPMGRSGPMDKGGPLDRVGVIDRGGPLGRDGPMDRGPSIGRDELFGREGSMDRAGLIGQDGPINRSGPLGRDSLMDRGGFLGRDRPLDIGGSMERDGLLNRGRHMGMDGLIDRGGPMGRDGPMDRGGPMGRDGPMDRGGSLGRDGTMDRGGPMGRDGPLGQDEIFDRRSLLGMGGPMDRDAPFGRRDSFEKSRDGSLAQDRLMGRDDARDRFGSMTRRDSDGPYRPLLPPSSGSYDDRDAHGRPPWPDKGGDRWSEGPEATSLPPPRNKMEEMCRRIREADLKRERELEEVRRMNEELDYKLVNRGHRFPKNGQGIPSAVVDYGHSTKQRPLLSSPSLQRPLLAAPSSQRPQDHWDAPSKEENQRFPPVMTPGPLHDSDMRQFQRQPSLGPPKSRDIESNIMRRDTPERRGTPEGVRHDRKEPSIEQRDRSSSSHDRDVRKKERLSPPTEEAGESVTIDELISTPGRFMRPPKMVFILRGPPGAGKSTLAKIIKDQEVENGGTAPRILCLDDYFMVDTEKLTTDPETGRKIKTKVMAYEYEAAAESAYRASLIKSFKKQIDDGFFPFIIVDCINNKLSHFVSMTSYALARDFEVFVGSLDMDPAICHGRNTHGRSLAEVKKIVDEWEDTPPTYTKLDLSSLVQEAAIQEVEMEDSEQMVLEEKKNNKGRKPIPGAAPPNIVDEDSDEVDAAEATFKVQETSNKHESSPDPELNGSPGVTTKKSQPLRLTDYPSSDDSMTSMHSSDLCKDKHISSNNSDISNTGSSKSNNKILSDNYSQDSKPFNDEEIHPDTKITKKESPRTPPKMEEPLPKEENKSVFKTGRYRNSSLQAIENQFLSMLDNLSPEIETKKSTNERSNSPIDKIVVKKSSINNDKSNFTSKKEDRSGSGFCTDTSQSYHSQTSKENEDLSSSSLGKLENKFNQNSFNCDKINTNKPPVSFVGQLKPERLEDEANLTPEKTIATKPNPVQDSRVNNVTEISKANDPLVKDSVNIYEDLENMDTHSEGLESKLSFYRNSVTKSQSIKSSKVSIKISINNSIPNSNLNNTENNCDNYDLNDHLNGDNYDQNLNNESINKLDALNKNTKNSLEPPASDTDIQEKKDSTKLDDNNLDEVDSKIVEVEADTEEIDPEDCEVIAVTHDSRKVKKRSLVRPCRHLKPHVGSYSEDFLDKVIDGSWLNDTHMDEAQALLHQQFPNVGGFQPVGVIEPGSGAAMVGTPNKPFIQIINTGQHWICVSTVEATPGCLHIFDSLGRRHILDSEIKQCLSWMMFFKGKYLTLEHRRIQKQRKHSDCGLYAIAVATAICHGLDPRCLDWHQSVMRPHLVQCFGQGMLTPFPVTGMRKAINRPSQDCMERIKLMCICRQPLEFTEENAAQCEICFMWFHQACCDIEEDVFADDVAWVCETCLENERVN